MTRVVVAVVDAQREFLDPTTEVGSWRKALCVPGIRRLLDHARAAGWSVLHVGTEHLDESSLPSHQQRRGIEVYCRAGSRGCEFVVKPEAGETEVFKTWYSAFSASEAAKVLESADIIVWAGVATDCCIEQSAFDADRRNIRSVVPIGAVSSSSRAALVESLAAIGKSAGDVLELDHLIAVEGLSATPLEPDDIRRVAAEWFHKQEERLGDADGLDLDEVLRRLEGSRIV